MDSLLQYQAIYHQLSTECEQVMNRREKDSSLLAEVVDLAQMVDQTLENNSNRGEMKTMMDIGAHCYMDAVVKDPSTIIVFVGANTYLEMTFEDAKSFLDGRIDVLRRVVDGHDRKVAQMRAQLEIVAQTIFTLQQSQSRPISS
jgi:prefoldin alpha subunit